MAGSGKWIPANQVYNELIRDQKHVHLNATKWPTLTAFVHDLTKTKEQYLMEHSDDGQLMIRYLRKNTTDGDKIDKGPKLTIAEVRELEKKREEKELQK